ncbi:winged helix-turn-helix transcriptional regulator [Nocardioides sp. MAHUQ-72]|uniref:winged helix-turn-helix transcriptional regulator n=1 Tax=unclassified Nocardioides TaxID=2615069 RepID=UPI00361DE7C5
MAKRYEQYCPIAHALDLVGDRWALLVVRELMHGPKRYTDLVEGLPGIGTNILAGRLRDLEQADVVTRRTLPPPAASKVYELTEYGRQLRPAVRELALWGARSLGPPTPGSGLFPGWMANAMDIVLAHRAPTGSFEFRVDGEVTSLVDGEVRRGPVEDPDVVVEADPPSIYDMFVNRRLDQVTVTGDRDLLERLVAVAPPRVEGTVTA